MFCRYCGTSIPNDSRFCRMCGKPIDVTIAPFPTDSIPPVLPLVQIPLNDVQPYAGNVPLVQGTPQISDVPALHGTPPSFGGSGNAAPSTPLSSPAPQVAGNPPAPSMPPRVTEPIPGSHLHEHQPPHSYPNPDPYKSPVHPPHEHQPPHPYPNPDPHKHPVHPPHEHHHHFQNGHLKEARSRSSSLRSTASQQALSGGVKVAGQISRRALLILLGGVAATSVVVGTVVIASNAVSTPEKTISNYLDALKNRDGQAAFNQLSSRLQSQLNEQQYISEINELGGFVSSYTISNVQQNDTNATASVSVTALIISANYTVSLVQENGVWKIDGGSLINIY